MKARRVQSVEMKPSQRITSRLYGDWLTLVFEAFGVPLVIKKGEEPKKYDFFEDTFLTMCKLTREDGIWWIGSGENRRRDDDEATPEEEAKVKMKEIESTLTGRHRATPVSAQQKDKEPSESTLGSYSRDARISKFQADLNEKEPTDFMMNWKRPKLRMPNF
ncbi:hypothetical protein Dimus_006220 [Dionaea muscipula]